MMPHVWDIHLDSVPSILSVFSVIQAIKSAHSYIRGRTHLYIYSGDNPGTTSFHYCPLQGAILLQKAFISLRGTSSRSDSRPCFVRSFPSAIQDEEDPWSSHVPRGGCIPLTPQVISCFLSLPSKWILYRLHACALQPLLLFCITPCS